MDCGSWTGFLVRCLRRKEVARKACLPGGERTTRARRSQAATAGLENEDHDGLRRIPATSPMGSVPLLSPQVGVSRGTR